MTRKLLAAAGLSMGLLLPVFCYAAEPGASMFDLFYDDARAIEVDTEPPKVIMEYVIKEMKRWSDNGVLIGEEDILDALAGGGTLCADKTDVDGTPLIFLQGGPGSCDDLKNSILNLLRQERETRQLETDLLSLAHGSELAVADEPHRPLDMALYAMILRRVWSGTGAAIIPWTGDADEEVEKLESDLSGASEDDLNKAVLRFRHGLFRARRENDPRFSGVMDVIEEDLEAIAAKLKITGDATIVGTFAVPKLGVENVRFWARRDDIGLMWIYPVHSYRMKIEPAGDYPEFKASGKALAYPFAYEGNSIPAVPGLVSPLCSRSIGREGYLCRPQIDTDRNCENTGSPNSIVLVKCSETTRETEAGPEVCVDFGVLFEDNGQPLVDPEQPGRLNPDLTPTDTDNLCTPETRVLYQDDITSHACYIGHCVQQSLDGHTLVPNRSPVVTGEATSPYLACIRPDPQLGLYTEIAADSPYPLPEYLGQFLVRDFERQFCARNGDPPKPLLGLCRFENNETAALPIESQGIHTVTTDELQKALELRGADFQAIAASIGQRASLDQAIELQMKTFARLAHFIKHIAGLLRELERAPLTQSACPWTGPFLKPPTQ